jgi:glycosyltransferase involved in cell wall biosynthesis
MTSWLLISGDFTPLGGMDRANHALAVHLALRPDSRVHLVTHRAWPDLEGRSAVRVHRVARPAGSHLLGAPLLAASGQRWARRLQTERPRVVANGGNADVGDISWVHYVHAAYTPAAAGPATRRFRARATHQYFVGRERAALPRARLVICNSRRTACDVVERLGVPDDRVRTVYYGADAAELSPVSAAEREQARAALGWAGGRRTALFVGALGDRRKGFDRLFDAWSRLLADPAWDVDLVAAGEGTELAPWRRRAAPFEGRVRLLGFRTDVPRLLAASDLLVHPARYEAYGLGVHEAICRGVPAIVSAEAGVAEHYPSDLRELLLRDVEDVDELCRDLRRWRADPDAVAARVKPFSDRLRSRSWDDMAAEIVALLS